MRKVVQRGEEEMSERVLRDGECPQCGWRGWYEDGEGDAYCREPGCPHAARVSTQDDAYAEQRKIEFANRPAGGEF